MKGFIEIHSENENRETYLINVSTITRVAESGCSPSVTIICALDDCMIVCKESYEEIKTKMEEATK